MKDTLAEEVVGRGPCASCGSEDNLVTYGDGHQFCYSPGCGLQKKADKEFEGEHEERPAKAETRRGTNEDFIPFTSDYMTDGLQHRKLTTETLSRFGYFVSKRSGKFYQIANYYGQDGQVAYQKYRTADKKFFFQEVQDTPPDIADLQLFMQQVWGEKHDKKVIVVEGEIDALSVAQATKYKIPVVSIPAGVVSATKSLKTNYRWLDRFDEIIFWFDNDGPGQETIPKCAELFEPGKVKTIVVPGVKDASELLQAGREGDVYAAVWSAVTWSPEGIMNARECVADMEKPPAVKIADWPWPAAQDKTKGIHEAEVVYHVAGTGVGKTSMIVEIQHKLLEAGVKFGIMRFEDTRQKTQLDLMSRRAGRRLHLEDHNPTVLRSLHTEVFGGGLVELFDPETAEWSFEAIEGYIRYMVKALDCKVVFIDPLSFLVAAVNETDERKALDHIAYRFGRYVKQLPCNLQVTHHLNRGDGKAFEEGGEISLKNIRGSAGLANFSMTIFAYERNQQGERPDLARSRCLKCRHTGFTGVMDVLKWDDIGGYYLPTDEPYPDDTAKDSGFGPVQQDDY